MVEIEGETLWVEILSRHGEVVARHRCLGPELRIGRGYTNDVVLDDPYVAAEHLSIRRDEAGALIAEDIGSANGLFAGQGKTRLARIALHGDQPVRIGRTFLRVREARHVVPRERLAEAQRRVWPAALALGLAALGIELLSLWLGETAEPHLSRYVESMATLAFPVLGWAGLWAVLARIFSGQARFDRHLLIALGGVLVLLLGYEVVKLVAFSFTWRSLASYQYLGAWCLAALICFAHLGEIAPSRARLNAAIVGSLAAIGIAMQVLVHIEQHSGGEQRVVATTLLPPGLRLGPPTREDAFFAEIERLKDAVDRARMTEPP